VVPPTSAGSGGGSGTVDVVWAVEVADPDVAVVADVAAVADVAVVEAEPVLEVDGVAEVLVEAGAFGP